MSKEKYDKIVSGLFAALKNDRLTPEYLIARIYQNLEWCLEDDFINCKNSQGEHILNAAIRLKRNRIIEFLLSSNEISIFKAYISILKHNSNADSLIEEISTYSNIEKKDLMIKLCQEFTQHVEDDIDFDEEKFLELIQLLNIKGHLLDSTAIDKKIMLEKYQKYTKDDEKQVFTKYCNTYEEIASCMYIALKCVDNEEFQHDLDDEQFDRCIEFYVKIARIRGKSVQKEAKQLTPVLQNDNLLSYATNNIQADNTKQTLPVEQSMKANDILSKEEKQIRDFYQKIVKLSSDERYFDDFKKKTLFSEQIEIIFNILITIILDMTVKEKICDKQLKFLCIFIEHNDFEGKKFFKNGNFSLEIQSKFDEVRKNTNNQEVKNNISNLRMNLKEKMRKIVFTETLFNEGQQNIFRKKKRAYNDIFNNINLNKWYNLVQSKGLPDKKSLEKILPCSCNKILLIMQMYDNLITPTAAVEQFLKEKIEQILQKEDIAMNDRKILRKTANNIAGFYSDIINKNTQNYMQICQIIIFYDETMMKQIYEELDKFIVRIEEKLNILYFIIHVKDIENKTEKKDNLLERNISQLLPKKRKQEEITDCATTKQERYDSYERVAYQHSRR